MHNILTRRSIRKFENKPISQEIITSIFQAAMSAPSAGNRQPWEFILIQDRKILDKIPDFHPYSKMVLEAPLAIVVCAVMERTDERNFWPQDCAAASQNILLAAHALGLGSVWCGIYPVDDLVKKFRKLLKLPKDVVPVSLIPIGYPAETKGPSDRYEEKRIHYDRW